MLFRAIPHDKANRLRLHMNARVFVHVSPARACVYVHVSGTFLFLSLFGEVGSISLTLILVKTGIVRAFLLGNQ